MWEDYPRALLATPDRWHRGVFTAAGAGFTAPEGRTMGHAGAIVSGSSGTAAAKQEALEAAGVRVGRTPSETARLVRELVTG